MRRGTQRTTYLCKPPFLLGQNTDHYGYISSTLEERIRAQDEVLSILQEAAPNDDDDIMD